MGSNATVVLRWLYVLSYFVRCNEVLELQVAPKRYALAPPEHTAASRPVATGARQQTSTSTARSPSDAASSATPHTPRDAEGAYHMPPSSMPDDVASVPPSLASDVVTAASPTAAGESSSPERAHSNTNEDVTFTFDAAKIRYRVGGFVWRYAGWRQRSVCGERRCTRWSGGVETQTE